MEMTHMQDRKEKDAFAERAAKRFAEDPKMYSYTDGEIKAGCYFALRFGLGDDCVVVFRIDEDEPTNYQQLVRDYENGRNQ